MNKEVIPFFKPEIQEIVEQYEGTLKAPTLKTIYTTNSLYTQNKLEPDQAIDQVKAILKETRERKKETRIDLSTLSQLSKEEIKKALNAQRQIAWQKLKATAAATGKTLLLASFLLFQYAKSSVQQAKQRASQFPSQPKNPTDSSQPTTNKESTPKRLS